MTTDWTAVARRPRGRGRRLGLRLGARMMVAVALVTALVTGVLASITFALARGYMLGQRQDIAVRQASVNARLVAAALSDSDSDLEALLTGLASDVESAVLLIDGSRRISSGGLVDPASVPSALIQAAESGHAARQRIVLAGAPVLVVGIPLGSPDVAYVEAFPLREIDRTFRFLSAMLTLGVVVSAVAGAFLGRWATTRALRPLTTLTAAAGAAAGGDLAVRLPADDPDLATLATTFNRTAARLQQRVVRDARFAGDVGHELRSPLTTMLNALAVLQRRRGELSEAGRQALDLLGADLTRFGSMVDDLLEISRATDDADVLDLEPVELGVLVSRTLAHADPPLEPGVELALPAHSVVVSVDPRRIERALANVVRNARVHGGGVRAVRVEADDDVAQVHVDDAGPGVDPADRERVFERFARGTRPGGRGSGLGLALVAQHVGRHGGRAWIEDAPGGGARVIVELPRERA